MAARGASIPSTRVISPSPTPTESSGSSYFAPITRSATKSRARPATSTESAIEEEEDSDSSLEARARARSRSPETAKRRAARRKDSNISSASSTASGKSSSKSSKRKTAAALSLSPIEGSNGHLAPPSNSIWRNLSPSRSPSPLGLIPIHVSFRSFIHRHEIPRKLLHVSIGFVTIYLYTTGIGASSIHPVLLYALVPVASLDVLRHNIPPLNKLYIKINGALMRESEVDGYNGVIWYLLGAWAVLRFLPKDVGVVSVLLLSWCDTAASTFGRLYGRYTPQVRKGKSLAGSVAAALTGVATAGLFWGYVSRRWDFPDGFMFTGTLSLPSPVSGALQSIQQAVSGGAAAAAASTSSGEEKGKVGGWLALGIVSLWSGFVGAASEVVDILSWDDNATIPILSGIGLWGFFKVFAS